MTSELPRLKDRAGAAQHLLRSANVDRPSHAARRRALSVAGALTTLGATSAVAAVGSGAVAKGVLLWVCVGALGGGMLALAVSELVAPAPSISRTTTMTSAALAVHTSEAATTQQVAPPPEPELAGSAAAVVRPTAPAPGSQEPLTSTEASGRSQPAASAAEFGDDPKAKPTLFEELRLIEAARASVGRASPSAALSVLDAYDRAYPGGQFQPEALALRIQALAQSGNKVGARALLAQFQSRYPRHPLLARAVSAVGD